MIQVVAESGYAGTIVEDVLSRAGASRRTFYEHYRNKQECFIAACDDVLADWMDQGSLAFRSAAVDAVGDAVGESFEQPFRVRLRAGLLALFARVLSDPLGARVLFIETLNCGSAGLNRLEEALDELERIVERGLEAPVGEPEFPSGVVKVIVGGVLEIVTQIRGTNGETTP